MTVSVGSRSDHTTIGAVLEAQMMILEASYLWTSERSTSRISCTALFSRSFIFEHLDRAWSVQLSPRVAARLKLAGTGDPTCLCLSGDQ